MDTLAAMDSLPVFPDFEPLPPVTQSLPVRLMRAREVVMARLRPILRSHGLTEQQWRVLRAIRDHTETEVTVLAGLVFLLPPSLSRILRDLESRGLIARRLSEQDQRRALLTLTADGLALIAATEPEMSHEAARMRRMFGPARVAELHRLLDELEQALGAPGLGEAAEGA